MIRHRHPRLQSLPGIALMLLLAVCMVVLPALSVAGQVHDAFEHAGMPTQHHEAPEAHADDTAEPDGAGVPAIHFLMHYAHCCVSLTALPVVVPAVAPPRCISGPAMPQPGLEYAQTRPDYPFRPPITA